MDELVLDEVLPFVESVLAEAGAIALRHFRQPLAVEDKRPEGRFDPVTIADRDVESCIRARLAERFPHHGIVGEEHAARAGSSRYSWIIDPIDGTRAFISGVPAWGILLGLRENGRPVAGWMHQPYLEETFTGCARGASLLRRGERRALHTRGGVGLGEAILYSTHPDLFAPAELPAFQRVAARVRLARFGGDCYSYCLLAAGFVDLVIESGLQAYDIQPLIPLIEAAGGIVSDRAGGSVQDGGFVVAAANAALHAEALRVLNDHGG